MKHRKLLLLFVALSVSAQLSAGVWSEAGEVESLYIHSGNEGAFVKRGIVLNPDNCARKDWLFLSKSNVNFVEIYSVLLAARASKQSVKVWVGGCSVNGWPVLEHVIY